MTEISFYHLSSSPLTKAMPKLLEKIIAINEKAVILVESEEKLTQYDNLLWSYSSRTFLAHGSKKDGYVDMHPIYLTCSDEHPNEAKFLIITDGIDSDFVAKFEKCLDIFDGNDEMQLQKARDRYKKYKNLGYNITYWKQNEDCGWEKNA